MKRMNVVAALATALMVGTTPCMATDSTMVTAAVASASAPLAEAVEMSAATNEVGPTGTVPGNTTADSTSTSTEAARSVSGMDFWHDVDAERGEIVSVAFEGDHNFNNLRVQSSAAFQSFRTQVESDQSISVYAPSFFTGASNVSPVFTVSDSYGVIDTFSVSVDYPRPHSDPDEESSPLFRLIAQIGFRLPQIPFISHLLDD